MNTEITLSLFVIIAVLVGALTLVVADHHFGNQPPDTTTLRDWCVELATTSKYPTLFVEGRGCVILVQEQSKRRES